MCLTCLIYKARIAVDHQNMIDNLYECYKLLRMVTNLPDELRWKLIALQWGRYYHEIVEDALYHHWYIDNERRLVYPGQSIARWHHCHELVYYGGVHLSIPASIKWVDVRHTGDFIG